MVAPRFKATQDGFGSLEIEFTEGTKEIVYFRFSWEGCTCYSAPIYVCAHSREKRFYADKTRYNGRALRKMLWYTLTQVTHIPPLPLPLPL